MYVLRLCVCVCVYVCVHVYDMGLKALLPSHQFFSLSSLSFLILIVGAELPSTGACRQHDQPTEQSGLSQFIKSIVPNDVLGN